MEGNKKSDTLPSVEHLQVMEVAEKRVLFLAETDAAYHDEDGHHPVEIKASNPRYWGTKVMFQMISNGSTRLCHGTKSRGSITSISIQSLLDVSKTALAGGNNNTTVLENNIREGMASLLAQTAKGEPGDSFNMSFGRDRKLMLTPTRERSSDSVLPPRKVTHALLTEG